MKQNTLLMGALGVFVASRFFIFYFFPSSDTIIHIRYKVSPLMHGEPED